jgi:CheY-like chemotaxis protein/HPt (histidine-containing phosphotransfer) domain-containing protein
MYSVPKGTLLCYHKLPRVKTRGYLYRFAVNAAGGLSSKTMERIMENSIDKTPEQSEDTVVILLADDSKSTHFLLSAILKKLSCKLDSAMNGSEAVEKIKKYSYDLIFMDSHMPVMDGVAAIREIRENERLAGVSPTPIVMMTADDSPTDIEKGLAAGASDYLIKPISRKSVFSTLNKFFAMSIPLDDEIDNVSEFAPDQSSDYESEPEDENVVYVDDEIKDLIPKYMERRIQDSKTILEALNKGDFDTIRIKGHTLKGSGGGYGFDQLTVIGNTIETAAKIEDADTIRMETEKMANYLQNVKIKVKLS